MLNKKLIFVNYKLNYKFQFLFIIINNTNKIFFCLNYFENL